MLINQTNMKSLVNIVLLLSISGLTYAQTIINAEALNSETDSSIYALAFAYDGTQGNLTMNQIGLSPNIILLRSRNEYKLLGGYSFLSEQGENIMNSGYIHLRHNFKISERLKTLAFYQVQFNEVLLLNQRQLFGLGLRYRLIDKDSLSYDISAGPMREYEMLDGASLEPGETIATSFTRASIVSSFSWEAGKNFSIHHVLYYQPYLSDFSDFRLLNDLNFVVSLSKYFSLVTAVTTRYDNLPPSTLKKFDNAVSIGVNVKF